MGDFLTLGIRSNSAGPSTRSLPSSGRWPIWLIPVLLLWIVWTQPVTAAPRIESPVTRLLFRPIGTNEPPLLATLSLEELFSRLRTSARPGSEPTESMIKEHMADLEKYLLDWSYTPRNTQGRPLSITSTWTDKTTGNPAVRTTRTFTYAANGSDLTEVRDGQNRLLESRTYNAARQLTQHRVYFGTGASDYQTTTYSYDPTTQRMSSSVSPAGLTTTWTYAGTAPNLTITRTTSPIASTATEIYANGRLTQSTDARGLLLTYLYDNLNRVTRITWPDQSTQEFDYTRVINGQTILFLDVQRSKDRMGQWTTFTYDGARRVTQVVDPANRTRSYAYCSCGQLESSTAGSGGGAETTTYQYRSDGRLTSVTAPGGRTVTSTYNLLGQRLSENDGVVTTTFAYNLQGLLIQANSPAGIAAKTVYDEEDRPWQSTDANGITVTRTYDLLGRPLQNGYPAVSGGQGATTELFAYPSPTQVTYTDQRSKVTQKTFDAAGRILTEVTANTPPETVTHGYGTNFLSRSLTDGRGKVTTWTFNAEGRLTAKRYHGQNFDQTTYTYRADGRPSSRRYYSSTSSFRETTYAYDASGNLTLTDYPTPTVDLTYTYDDKNRLATVVQSGLGTITLNYANGRLTEESGPWAKIEQWGQSRIIYNCHTATTPAGSLERFGSMLRMAAEERREALPAGIPGAAGANGRSRWAEVPRPKRQLTLRALQDAPRGSRIRGASPRSLRLCGSTRFAGLRPSPPSNLRAGIGSVEQWGQSSIIYNCHTATTPAGSLERFGSMLRMAAEERREALPAGIPGAAGANGRSRWAEVPRPKRQLTLRALQDAPRGSRIRGASPRSLRLCGSTRFAGLRPSPPSNLRAGIGSVRPLRGRWAHGTGNPAVIRPPATFRDAFGVQYRRAAGYIWPLATLPPAMQRSPHHPR